MRQAFSDIGWLQNKVGAFAGLSLGYDRCADHEWGIRDLETMFELGPIPYRGAETRVMKSVAGKVYFAKGERKTKSGYVPYAVFTTLDYELRGKTPADGPEIKAQFAELLVNPPSGVFILDGRHSKSEVKMPETPSTAWDSRGFCVTAYGDEQIERVEQLYKAALAGDVCLTQASSLNPFSSGGLCLVVFSSLSAEEKAEILATDEAHIALVAADEATGIREVLAKAGCESFALAPAWIDNSDHCKGLRYFLNPREQKKYRAGWFSVDELHAWSRGEGPVLKPDEPSEPASAPRAMSALAVFDQEGNITL